MNTPRPTAPVVCEVAKSSASLCSVDVWKRPAVVAPNNFVHKSLSNWAVNVAVGCEHGCGFCYVAEASTIKLGDALKAYGVTDPDLEWGKYVLVRPWDEKAFMASLRRAQVTPQEDLKADGNRAIIYCSTTDAYQVIHHPDPARQRELSGLLRFQVRRSLELIRDNSTLNVRILTRSPLARVDFDLFRSFGSRLLFGMSLPTLRNDLARLYEPNAPAPSQRLATLRAAKHAGLNVFVALAPTYPECDEADLQTTLKSVADLGPLTVFHEPINMRADNVARIETRAAQCGATLRTDVFGSRERWQDYALESLCTVERLAQSCGLSDKLHLWPDAALGSKAAIVRQSDPAKHLAWLQKWWTRISEWPGQVGSVTPD